MEWDMKCLYIYIWSYMIYRKCSGKYKRIFMQILNDSTVLILSGFRVNLSAERYWSISGKVQIYWWKVSIYRSNSTKTYWSIDGQAGRSVRWLYIVDFRKGYPTDRHKVIYRLVRHKDTLDKNLNPSDRLVLSLIYWS
jgi:hypothetical protein